MAKDMSIKYSTVKVLEMDKVLDTCGNAAATTRKLDKLEGTVWEQTVISIMEKLDVETYEPDTSKEGIEAIRTVLFGLMEKNILDAGVAIPEFGLDRDGKQISLFNEKTHTTKWSSWDKTRRIFAYLGDIAKILGHDKAIVLYPSVNKVASRCDILAECKAATNALDNIIRLAGQMQGFLDVLDAKDSIAALEQIQSLVVEGLNSQVAANVHITSLDSVCSKANDADKAIIRDSLFAMATRNFKAVS